MRNIMNIEHIDKTRENIINRYLKYLWDKKTSLSLKIIALEYLSQFTDDELIKDKLASLYKRECNRELREIFDRVLQGEDLFIKDIDDDEYLFSRSKQNTNNDSPDNNELEQRNSLVDILKLKSSYISTR